MALLGTPRPPLVCTWCGAAAPESENEPSDWTTEWAQFTIFLGLLP